MNVSTLEWSITLVATTGVLLFDLLVIGRRPHEPTVRECMVALSAYVGMAVAFGVWIWLAYGEANGQRFFAGWLTEYSLSVDNLFVFLIIMTSFKVPKAYQQEALMVGIVLALVFRGVLIALGAVAIDRFSWTFYIFGGFLVWVAVNLFRDTERANDTENMMVRLARRYLNTTDTWDGLKFYVKGGGIRLMTPMFLVILALGTTDFVFALDSIPAIYGLTQAPYLVFVTNVFALMGLRQLYFLFGNLLHRLVYLSKGLAVILVFIGAEMIVAALRENELSFINGGKPFDLPEAPVSLSLGVIAAALVLTTVLSLHKTRALDARQPERCGQAIR